MRHALLLVLVGCAAPAPKPAPPAQPPALAEPAATAAAPPATKPAFAYPPARLGNDTDTFHGVAIADPYRWLEDMQSAETRQWVSEQNAVTDAYLAKLPGRDAWIKRIGELNRYESFGIPQKRGNRYFWFYKDGVQSQAVIYTATSLDAKPALLLDPNTFSSDGSFALAGLSYTANGARMAYGLSIGGGDWQRWKIRDVATGKELPEELTHIKYYDPVFTADGTGIYYSRFPEPPPGKELVQTDIGCKVYFHRVGTSTDKDIVVYEHPDHPTWQYDLKITDDGRYLVITIGDGQVGDRGQELVSYLDLKKPGAKPVALIDQYDAEYLFAGNDGPVFYFQTSLDATNKRVIAIDIRTPARAQWKEIVPDGKHAIQSVKMTGRQLLVTTMQDAHHAVTAYDLRGKLIRQLELPGLGSAAGFAGRAADKAVFYLFSGFTTPGTVYRYDLASGTSTLWKQPKVPFDPGQLETQQVFFASKDGTKVPMFITAKKGLPRDGANPVIMTGYGFGGISSTPRFSSSMIAWLERGGVSVLVNIRGGGEYGQAWHHAARRENRQTGLDDFIAAGEWLVANKVTAPAHLGITGGSGGGFLVAAVLVQRPDLYGAVLPFAGVHDMMRFQLFGQGAGWQGDWGSIDDPAQFKTLRAVSPLHNAKPGTRFPPTFIVTADHDVRVAPLHSYKLAATLQAAQAGPAPIVMRVQTKSGHGGGTTLAQAIEQQAERYMFFASSLGLKAE